MPSESFLCGSVPLIQTQTYKLGEVKLEYNYLRIQAFLVIDKSSRANLNYSNR
jgi:hypothetical protein